MTGWDDPTSLVPDETIKPITATDALLGIDPCWQLHPVICPSYPRHPLIRERGNFYLEVKSELALKSMVRSLKEQN